MAWSAGFLELSKKNNYFMTEEIGPETPELQQHVMESVEEVKEELAKEKVQSSQERQWIGQIGVSTAILSALAAFTAMQAGSLANEAMVAQIRSADQWALYQAKSTKQHLERSTVTLLQSFQKPIPVETTAEINKLKQDMESSQTKALELEEESNLALYRHELFARTVAALQIGISLGAVAALVRKKSVWYLGLTIAGVGVVFMVMGIFPSQHNLSSHSPHSQVSIE